MGVCKCYFPCFNFLVTNFLKSSRHEETGKLTERAGIQFCVCCLPSLHFSSSVCLSPRAMSTAGRSMAGRTLLGSKFFWQVILGDTDLEILICSGRFWKRVSNLEWCGKFRALLFLLWEQRAWGLMEEPRDSGCGCPSSLSLWVDGSQDECIYSTGCGVHAGDPKSQVKSRHLASRSEGKEPGHWGVWYKASMCPGFRKLLTMIDGPGRPNLMPLGENKVDMEFKSLQISTVQLLVLR